MNDPVYQDVVCDALLHGVFLCDYSGPSSSPRIATILLKVKGIDRVLQLIQHPSDR